MALACPTQAFCIRPDSGNILVSNSLLQLFGWHLGVLDALDEVIDTQELMKRLVLVVGKRDWHPHSSLDWLTGMNAPERQSRHFQPVLDSCKHHHGNFKLGAT